MLINRIELSNVLKGEHLVHEDTYCITDQLTLLLRYDSEGTGTAELISRYNNKRKIYDVSDNLVRIILNYCIFKELLTEDQRLQIKFFLE